MRKFLVAVALVCALPTTAQADSFTFVSRNDILNRVVAPVAGSKTIVAQFSTGEITATYPNRKVVSKSQCATWPAPPGGLFTTSGACVATDADGSQYTVVVSCRAVEGSAAIGDCFGQLTGTAGAYRGRTGTVSWRSTQSADGKTSTATGTGMWN
jgi:hypothetical protein